MFNIQTIKPGRTGFWPESLNTSLAAYWRLDETSGSRLDALGANNLTNNNSVGSTRGVFKNASTFVSASSQSLSAASNSVLQTGDINYTIAFWVYMTANAASMLFVSKDNDSASGREYLVQYVQSTNRFRYLVYDGTNLVGNVSATTFGAPSLNTWYFIVCSHDPTGNLVSISVNNGAADTAATTGAAATTTTAFYLGNRAGGAASYLDGSLDEVGFWKRALTSFEQTALYNAGLGTTRPY